MRTSRESNYIFISVSLNRDISRVRLILRFHAWDLGLWAWGMGHRDRDRDKEWGHIRKRQILFYYI